MKPIPRHWASVRETRTLADGRELDLTVHGSSDESPQDAERDARDRLERLVASGGPGRANDPDREYYPDRRLPEELLEELHGPDGELIAAITRNRYGAAVLNTDALLITDIDLVEPSQLDRAQDPRAAASSPACSAVPRSRCPRRRPIRMPSACRASTGAESSHARSLALIETFRSQHPELGVRTYRTRNGFRLLVTGSDAAPRSERARELMEQVWSDELYMILCRVHDTYRARLTPKPWRIDVDRFESLGTRLADDQEHQDWVARYRAASQDVAVCRLLDASGPAPSAVEQQIIDLHDRATLPESGLRLA